jgi:hypothetical protein
MIEFILQILFASAQEPSISGWVGAEFIVALGVGLLGYQLYNNVKTPTDDWDSFLKTASIFMMAFGAVDAVITAIRLFVESSTRV